MHKDNKHYTPIIQPGIAYRPGSSYTPYTEGENNGYFITYDENKTAVIGYASPGEVVFPDFS